MIFPMKSDRGRAPGTRLVPVRSALPKDAGIPRPSLGIKSLPLRVNVLSLLFTSFMTLVMSLSGVTVVRGNETNNALARAERAASELGARIERLIDKDLGVSAFSDLMRQ